MPTRERYKGTIPLIKYTGKHKGHLKNHLCFLERVRTSEFRHWRARTKLGNTIFSSQMHVFDLRNSILGAWRLARSPAGSNGASSGGHNLNKIQPKLFKYITQIKLIEHIENHLCFLERVGTSEFHHQRARKKLGNAIFSSLRQIFHDFSCFFRPPGPVGRKLNIFRKKFKGKKTRFLIKNLHKKKNLSARKSKIFF